MDIFSVQHVLAPWAVFSVVSACLREKSGFAAAQRGVSGEGALLKDIGGEQEVLMRRIFEFRGFFAFGQASGQGGLGSWDCSGAGARARVWGEDRRLKTAESERVQGILRATGQPGAGPQ